MRLRLLRLQELIGASALSQNHWAMKVGISRGHWSEIVNGKHPYLSPKTRARVLDAFGASVGDLFEIEPGVEPWADLDFRRAIADRYLIDREIGQGGMGAVYLARDIPRGRMVAIKVVAPETVSGIGIDQFLREISTVAQLSHPNILSLFDSGVAAGHPFFVMPLVRGGSLRARLQASGRLSTAEAATLLRGIAAGLHFAHAERVLHCDIKPENVLLHDDHAYVMDFGIARKLRTESFEWSLKNEFDLSAGTPAYVSPEQAAGERDLDARSDVYSLACMMFESLAGRPPFEGTSTQAVVARRFIVPPPPVRDLAPDVPAGVQSILERAISLPRNHRPETVAAFADEFAYAAHPGRRAFAGVSFAALRGADRLRRRLRIPSAWPVGRLLADASRDLAIAWRGLCRAPGFTAVVVLTIGLALGANATMYGIVDRLLLRPPAHIVRPEEVQQLRIARWTPQGYRPPSNTLTYPTFTAMRERTTTLAGAAAVHPNDEVSVGAGAQTFPLRADEVTGGYFTLLGPTPALGRFIDEGDDQNPAGRNVVVLSYGVWKERYGENRDALGQSIIINGESYEIVGVAPRDFTGPDLHRVDLWLPMAASARTVLRLPDRWTSARSWFFLQVYVRVRSGTRVDAALADATRAYREDNEKADAGDAKAAADLTSMSVSRDRSSGASQTRVTAWLYAMAIIVMLIASANVANLVLARGVSRRGEVAVRRALGVSSARLVRLMLTESALLALLGAAAGLAVARWGGGVLRNALLPGITWDQSPVNPRVVAVTGAATLFVAVMAGLIPLLAGSRGDLATTLRAGGRGVSGAPRRTLRALLLVQITLATVLVAGAGLFVRSIGRARALDLGFSPQGLLYGSINLSATHASKEEVLATYRDVMQRVRSAPGVRGTGIMIGAPLMNNYATRVRVPGLDSLPALPGGGPYYFRVSAGALEAMQVRLLRGRLFTDHDDRPGAMNVVVVTDLMARTVWPGRDPLAQCLILEITCAPVVGVIADFHRNGFKDEPFLSFFEPLAASADDEIPRAMIVRVDGPEDRAIALVHKAIADARPDLPFVSIKPYEGLVDQRARSWSLGATMFTIFGAVSVLMAAVGVYGVLSYLVTQRTQELGIRAALGATPGSVMRMIVFDSLMSVLIAVALGIGLVFACAGSVQPMLFETAATDPAILAFAAILIALVTLAATVIPGRRASKSDPLRALRAD